MVEDSLWVKEISMARITHRCSCGKGLRLYMKERKYGSDLRIFLDPDTRKPHWLGVGHYIVGVEPKIVTLEEFGVVV